MLNNSDNSPKIRVRFPPSPTGFLHVGSARTALFNYLFAQKSGGELVLRIEDTDQTRQNNEGEADIYESLKWLGIKWNEGPDIGGPHKLYKQTQRTELYEAAVKTLLANGKAYRCFCSTARLEKLRKEADLKKQPFRYDNFCRGISEEESEKRAQTENFVVRLKADEQEIAFNDIIRGPIKFVASATDDFVISKGLKNALYHLAVVVDDAEMEITHIIRGEDGLSNTPKHIRLQKALGYPTPIYAHLPLLLDENRKKLSKRSGEVSMFVKTLREEEGYLSEAIINGLALLGWNSKTDQVVFTLEELVKSFDLNNVQKGGAVFSVERLNWLNKQHIKKLSLAELVSRIGPFVDRAGLKVEKEFLTRLIQIERERITLLKEIPVLAADLIKQPAMEKEKIAWKKDDAEKAKEALNYLSEKIATIDNAVWGDQLLLEKTILEIVDGSGMGRATMLWPMRYALTGKEKSAGPAELAWLFGKVETIKRIAAAVVQLG